MPLLSLLNERSVRAHIPYCPDCYLLFRATLSIVSLKLNCGLRRKWALKLFSTVFGLFCEENSTPFKPERSKLR